MYKFDLGPIELRSNNVVNIFGIRTGVIHGSTIVNPTHPIKIVALPDDSGLYLVEYISTLDQIVRLGFKEKDLYPIEQKVSQPKKKKKKTVKEIKSFFYNGNPLTLINK